MKIFNRFVSFFTISFFSLFSIVSAHEAYVLPTSFFWKSIHSPNDYDFFVALKNTDNLKTTLIIIGFVFLFLILNFLFRLTSAGRKLHLFIERFAFLGPHFVRYSLAISFFLSAFGNVFLGPELLGTMFSHPHLIQILLFVISILIAIGFMTEIASLIGIIIFVSSFFVYGRYVFTYVNYLGELLVLLLFGMRNFSFDKIIFGPLKRFKNIRKYETFIIRLFYGLALIYAAITVKLFHPEITMAVVNQWNLTQFHWLFPSDPLLITLGAGIVEFVIGLFIIVGFEMRLTILISLFYITLSLIFFKEAVWPHLLLYGISLNLLVQPETFSLDNLFFCKKNKKI